MKNITCTLILSFFLNSAMAYAYNPLSFGKEASLKIILAAHALPQENLTYHLRLLEPGMSVQGIVSGTIPTEASATDLIVQASDLFNSELMVREGSKTLCRVSLSYKNYRHMTAEAIDGDSERYSCRLSADNPAFWNRPGWTLRILPRG